MYVNAQDSLQNTVDQRLAKRALYLWRTRIWWTGRCSDQTMAVSEPWSLLTEFLQPLPHSPIEESNDAMSY